MTSPATAKNCITAGATEVAGQSFITNPQYVTADMTLHQPSTDQGGAADVQSYTVRSQTFRLPDSNEDSDAEAGMLLNQTELSIEKKNFEVQMS